LIQLGLEREYTNWNFCICEQRQLRRSTSTLDDTDGVNEKISEQAKAAKVRSEIEDATERRLIGRIAGLGGAMLVVSVLLAWMNHPKIVRSSIRPHPYIVVEVSHSIGLTTLPAGPIALALGIGIVFIARWQVRGEIWAGWVVFLTGLGSLGVGIAEFTQLLLGRRNYLEHASLLKAPLPPYVNAVGTGVWLAIVAAIVVVTAAWTFLWRSSRYWGRLATT
jgi:hypothetical protein